MADQVAGQRPRPTRPPWPPRWRTWFLACTAGEVVGMAAAASCAGAATAIVGEPHDAVTAGLVILAAVIGGCIEGLAVGELQYRVLRGWIPGLPRRGYVGGTVAVAATFWLLGMLPPTIFALTTTAGASVPSAAAADEPSALVIGVISGLGGAVGGAAFGLVQCRAMRGHVDHPWRWIRPNAIGWAIAVAWITVAASSIPAGLSIGALAAAGIGVGLVAGAAVSLVTGQALPSLALNLPWWNRVVADLLLSPFHLAMSRTVALVWTAGRRSGRLVAVPAEYSMSPDGTRAVIFPAHSERKRWWRNFEQPHMTGVIVRGVRREGIGKAISPEDPSHDAAAETYRARHPRITILPNEPLVVIDLAQVGDGS